MTLSRRSPSGASRALAGSTARWATSQSHPFRETGGGGKRHGSSIGGTCPESASGFSHEVCVLDDHPRAATASLRPASHALGRDLARRRLSSVPAAHLTSPPVEKGSGNADAEPEAEAAVEGYPEPHPSQDFVAHAEDGRPYARDAEATRFRMVVSDLDGTLLGPDKTVAARTLEAVRRARKKSIIFVPASGRSKAGMFDAMGSLGEELRKDGAPFICMNGLEVYGQGDGDHGDVIYSEQLSLQLAMRIVDFWKTHPLAERAGVSLCGSHGDTTVGSFHDVLSAGMKLNRLFFWGDSRAGVDAFKEDLSRHLDGHPAELTRGIAEMIEVLPPGASKAVGLKALLDNMGVHAEEVIALGDEENDVEMLAAAGHGVAMGQAGPKVRRAARYTAPTNALHGVAVALETFCGV